MFNPELFAVNFARTLDLLRAPVPNKDQQKASLRAVFALTSLASAMLRLYDGVLSVDDAVLPDDLPFMALLRRQIEAHGISEIAVARGATPTELLTLLRALALDPAALAPGDGVTPRLDALGSSGIAVLAARRECAEGGPRAPSVTQAFELAAIEEAAAATAPTAAPKPAPSLEPPERPVAPIFTPAAAPAAPAPDAEPAAAVAVPHGVPADTLIGAALGVVLRNPYDVDILDRLSELAEEIANTLRERRLELALQATAAIIGLEPGAPEGSARASYGIVLRRILNKDALQRIAHLLPDPRFTPLATAVMQRAGTDGVETLVDRLSTSEVAKERKAYLAALRAVPQGPEAVLEMLGHHQWSVVRNVADLLGEMHVEEAVPALGGLLAHKEPRVQRAAAVALAHIGTAATVEPLHRAMLEGTPELRGLVAASIGGAHASALALPLAALAEAEPNGDVQSEYYRALGRIASPEAVDALVRAAQPGGRIFGRRPVTPRVAAVEGLRNAGGPAAREALEALQEDADKAVRDAAVRALAAAVPSPRSAG